MMSIVAMARPAPFNHAADLAIERDVVQVILGGGEFLGVFLGLVAQPAISAWR